jgi:hypothetical protein
VSRTSAAPVPGISDLRTVAAGGGFTLAISNDGKVLSWGDNSYGQLGRADTLQMGAPLAVAGLGRIQSIAAGTVHSVALSTDGSIFTWGGNAYGQLGNGTTAHNSKPANVAGLSGITAVSTGEVHTLALRKDGTLLAWGGNAYGQLGNDSTRDQATPVSIMGLILAIPAETLAVASIATPAQTPVSVTAPAAKPPPATAPSPPTKAAQQSAGSCKACRVLTQVKVFMATDGIEIVADGSVESWNSFTLSEPARLVIDICCATNAAKGKTTVYKVNQLGIDTMRIGDYPDKLRVVLQSPLAGFPEYRALKTANGIKVILTGK